MHHPHTPVLPAASRPALRWSGVAARAVRLACALALLASAGAASAGSPPPYKARVVTDGNSLTAGDGVPSGSSYPAQLQALLGTATYVVNNVGISGQSTGAMRDYATDVDALYEAANPYAQIVVAWEGTNEISWYGNSVQATFNILENYCLTRRALGFRCIVGTVLPRSETVSGHPNWTTFETNRQQLNAFLRQYWRFFADGLFDPAADSRIGDAGDEASTTYYQPDRVHLNAAGAAIVAALVRAQVDRVARISVKPTSPVFFDDFSYGSGSTDYTGDPAASGTTWYDVDGGNARTGRAWYGRWWDTWATTNPTGRIAFVQDAGNASNRALRLRVNSGESINYNDVPWINSPYHARSGTWMARVSFDDLDRAGVSDPQLIQAFWLWGQAQARGVGTTSASPYEGRNWFEFDHEWDNFFGNRGTGYPCTPATVPSSGACAHGQLDTGYFADAGGPTVSGAGNLMTNPLETPPYSPDGYRCFLMHGDTTRVAGAAECLSAMVGSVQQPGASAGRWDRYVDLLIKVNGDQLTFGAAAVERAAGQPDRIHYMERTVRTLVRPQPVALNLSNLLRAAEQNQPPILAPRASDLYVDWVFYTPDTSLDLWTAGGWVQWMRERGKTRVSDPALPGAEPPYTATDARIADPRLATGRPFTMRVESPATVPAGSNRVWTAFAPPYWNIQYETRWSFRTRKFSSSLWSNWSSATTHNGTLTRPEGTYANFYATEAQVEAWARERDVYGAPTGTLVLVASGCIGTLNGFEVTCESDPARADGAAAAPAAEGLTVAPNPAVGTATVAFSLPTPGAARLAVYDGLGREVAVLLDGEAAGGAGEVLFDTSALAPGVYVVRLVSGSLVLTHRMAVVR